MQPTICGHLPEDLLHRFCLLRLAGTPEMVEGNSEPLVDVLMHDMVFVAYLPGAEALLERFGLSCRPILVGAAYVDGSVAPRPAVTCVHICREHTTDYVSKMRHIVHIRQRGGNEHVARARFWEHRGASRSGRWIRERPDI